jgi:hypothetical protein
MLNPGSNETYALKIIDLEQRTIYEIHEHRVYEIEIEV